MPRLDPYQATGALFLRDSPFAYLADEPGLGKTPQAIVAANWTGLDRVHVTCPANAVPNWHREIAIWAAKPEGWTVSSFDGSTEHLPEAQIHICDEAHYLCTATSSRTRKILLNPGSPLRRAARTWALSGTPAPNTPVELWSWMHSAGVTKLSYNQFLVRYCEYHHTDYGLKITKILRVGELAGLLQGFMLRRTVARVMPTLPGVTFGVLQLDAVDPSSDIYVDVPDLEDEEHVARIRRLIGEAKAGPLAAVLSNRLETTPGKICVYAHHSAVIDTISEALAQYGVVCLSGKTPKKMRGAVVGAFQTNPDVRVFVGQIMAAGTAITLTAADYLVFAERSFTPEDNKQVWKRIHRWGQTKDVHIDYAHLKGTIDDGVVSVNKRKSAMLDALYERIDDR